MPKSQEKSYEDEDMEDLESQESEAGPNALDLLREDHRKVQELFEQFEQADTRSKQRIVEEALTELEIHAKLEEGLIYPAIREETNAEELMDMALEEHHVATTLIKELKKMKPKDERFEAKFKVLAESVKHHIEEEENEIFPQAEETDLDFSELGMEAMERKEKLMGKSGKSSSRSKKKSSSAPGRSGRSRKRKAA